MNNRFSRSILVACLTMAFVGTVNAKLVKEPLGLAGEVGQISATQAEETLNKQFVADNNAHAGTKTVINLDSSNGNQYRLYGHIDVITFGNSNGTMDATTDIVREGFGRTTVINKNCSNCDAVGNSLSLIDYKPGGVLFGYEVKFGSLYPQTYGAAYKVDYTPGIDPKKIDGFDAKLTNFVLGKGNNGKTYGFRFDPATLAVVFYENIGTTNEAKTGEIKMTTAPVAPPVTTVNCKKKTGLINCH